MKVGSITQYNNFSFRARKKEIKKADSIERAAKANFPMISPTYIDDFYRCAKPCSINYKKANDISTRVQNDILKRRYSYALLKSKQNAPEDIIYALSLHDMKKEKTGNCMENAMAALTVLFANGYYNSERVELFYKASFINKKTGEIEYEDRTPLNHSFVLTDMKKEGEEKGKKNVVIDPWLGFADSLEGARGRFKQFYNGDLSTCKEMFTKLFKIDKLQKGEQFSPDDYDIRLDFEFLPCDDFEFESEKRQLGFYARCEFDGITLP